MTAAIREEGWQGGEAAAEAPLRAFGLLERGVAAAPPADAPAQGDAATPAEAPWGGQAPPQLGRDRLDPLTALRVNAVLDAAKVASGDLAVEEGAVNGALDSAVYARPAPPKPKKKRRKKKRGRFRKIGRKLKAAAKKAGRAVKGIVKGAARFVKGVVKAAYTWTRTLLKTTLALARTAFRMGARLLRGDFKGA